MRRSHQGQPIVLGHTGEGAPVVAPNADDLERIASPWADDCRGCLHYVDGAGGFALRLHTPVRHARTGIHTVTCDVLVAGVLIQQVVQCGGAFDSVRWAVRQACLAACNLLGAEDAHDAFVAAVNTLRTFHAHRDTSCLGDWCIPAAYRKRGLMPTTW